MAGAMNGVPGVVFQVRNVKRYGDMEVVERTAELFLDNGYAV